MPQLRQIHDYKVEDETWDEQRDAGRYNPAKVITLHYRRREYRLTIAAGRGDSVSIWREGDRAYVLAVNYSLPYCGIEAFDLRSDLRVGEYGAGEVFLQEGEVEEELGKRGVDLAPATIVRRLASAIDC